MRDLKDKVAVVTGAASGIGRALAERLLQEGCALALSDIDEEGLRAFAAELSTDRVTIHPLDVSDRQAVHNYAETVKATHGTAHLIINNAGVGHADSVEHLAYDDLEWVMNINFWGVVHGTKAFLPMLLGQNEGHIVNISSVFGLIGVPTQSAYCASKFAVRGFTESLAVELAGTGVRTSSVHPGGVRTRILERARVRRTPDGESTEKGLAKYDRFFRMTAPHAAQVIVDGIKRDRPRIIVGQDATLLDIVQRLFPRSYTRLVRRGLKT